MAADCTHKETDRCLKEQFINGLNNDCMATEIIRELKVISYASSVTGAQVLAKEEGQVSQTAMLESLKMIKTCNTVRQTKQYAKHSSTEKKHATLNQMAPTITHQIDVKMQVLQFQLFTNTLPTIWKKMWRMWKGKSLQRSVQEQENSWKTECRRQTKICP